jgi:fluoroquinolone transport system permease protein
MNINILKYDFLQIRKDPMLMLSSVVPIIIWTLVKYGFPQLQSIILANWEFDISKFYFQTVVFFLPLIPMMFGMVYGFMLLDERDEGIITAISVTPFGKLGYLKLRMFLPTLISFIVIILFSVFLNVLEIISFWRLIVLSALLSLNAPIMLLFLGAFAGNKVEGMAISKGFGLLLAAIVIDFIVPSPYNWISVYSPLVWIEKAFFSQNINLFLLYGIIAAISHLFLLWILNRRFTTKYEN